MYTIEKIIRNRLSLFSGLKTREMRNKINEIGRLIITVVVAMPIKVPVDIVKYLTE